MNTPFITIGRGLPGKAAVAAADASLERDLRAIIEAVGRADREGAIALATAAVRGGLEHPLALVLAAEGFEVRGEIEQALAILSRVTEMSAGQPEPWRRKGALLARVDRLEEAIQAFESALSADPNSSPALLACAAASYRLGDFEAAAQRYERALALEPDAPEALAGMASIAARSDDAALAREFATRALAIDPSHPGARLALARADSLDGKTAASELGLSALLDSTDLAPQMRIAALDLRAEIRDSADRPAEAFLDYQARNRLLEDLTWASTRVDAVERRVAQARRLARDFGSCADWGWSAAAARGAETLDIAGHVFLVGFPRSGTTLLEKVLAAHGGVVTLEEVELLVRAGGHLLKDRAGLETLSVLAPEAANACRAIYRDGVAAILGPVTGKVLVDKLPLNTIALPLVAKLFPRAKVIFAVRDPRDVVLSCFRRRFRMNSAMFEFLNLESAADYYDAVMTLAELYRAQLPIDLIEAGHEAIVADFDREIARILSFVGLDWDEAVRSFTGRSTGRNQTPSDRQLNRGLNADGVGQWRRYASELAPVLPRLEPWVRRFGYPA